jgi:hypothetical protein
MVGVFPAEPGALWRTAGKISAVEARSSLAPAALISRQV